MANLPEKNVVLVDKITNVPTDSNLFINANGEFKQASVNDVVNSSTVVSTAVETAINTAVQDSIDSNFKQTSGSPILLTDSADGTLIDFKGKGRSTQTQYSGKNLANVKDKTSGTAEGITSSIANEVVTASGTSTGNGDIFISLSTNIVMESGTDYTISIQEITGTMPSYFTVYLYDDSTSIFSNYDTMSTSNSSVVFNLTDTIECSGVLFRISTNNTINGTFRLQIEKGTTKTDYEPYVGGTASPNPEYPQAIKSVGDMGWFDGELIQGYYDSTNGVHTNNGVYVCSKNQIPCNGGDTIKLTYGSTARIINFVFFDEDGVFLSNTSATNTTAGFVTAPTNASYFVFNVNESVTSALTPQTAKHITVTINGKYALIVKSVGKNLLENTATSQTINGVTFTVNDDKSVTVNGTATADSLLTLGTTTAKKGNEYRWSGCPSGGSDSTYYLFAGFTIDYYNQVKDYGYGSGTGVLSGDTTFESYIMVKSGTTINATFYPMIRKAEVTDGTYEPYKETVTYIPLNEPLRSRLDGSVKDEVSLNKVTRRFAEVVLDGTEDWYFSDSSDINYTYTSGISNAKPNSLVVCNAMCSTDLRLEENNCYINANKIPIFCSDSITSVDEFKAWLQANPITVVYELAEPIVEEIEPVDIVTYDNVTYLTASDNAEMEIEYPTTKVAGIASIGYSKGIKAEYETEQLKKQLLEIQATIVNTL